MTQRNARFWIYGPKGLVKLTLSPECSLTYSRCEDTDEGYRAARITYEFDGLLVTRETEINSRDCDGRLDLFSTHVARLESLRRFEPVILEGDLPAPDVMLPFWEKVKASQRDHTAERMGY